MASAVVFAMVLVACADQQNAVLEVEITLPPQLASSDQVHVVTQFRRAAGYPFEAEWEPPDSPGNALTDAQSSIAFSVVTEDPNTDVNVRLRFCSRAQCEDLSDDNSPERWFVLEQPFYMGERTFWSAEIATIPDRRPSSPERADRCSIRGCNEGGEVSSYCRLDGRHLCE
jgi:hypothetical protein